MQQDSLINIMQPLQPSKTVIRQPSPVKRKIHIVSGPIKRLKSAAIRSVFDEGQRNPAKDFESLNEANQIHSLPPNLSKGAYKNQD